MDSGHAVGSRARNPLRTIAEQVSVSHAIQTTCVGRTTLVEVQTRVKRPTDYTGGSFSSPDGLDALAAVYLPRDGTSGRTRTYRLSVHQRFSVRYIAREHRRRDGTIRRGISRASLLSVLAVKFKVSKVCAHASPSRPPTRVRETLHDTPHRRKRRSLPSLTSLQKLGSVQFRFSLPHISFVSFLPSFKTTPTGDQASSAQTRKLALSLKERVCRVASLAHVVSCAYRRASNPRSCTMNLAQAVFDLLKTTLSQAWSGNCIRGPQCAFEMSMFMCPAVHKLTRN